MILRMIQKRRAASSGVPFTKEKFWPPFYLMMGQEVSPGVRCISGNRELYDAKVGDIVPVMVSDTVRHFYRLKGWSYASGSDHIASPKQFDIEYHHSEPLAAKAA